MDCHEKGEIEKPSILSKCRVWSVSSSKYLHNMGEQERKEKGTQTNSEVDAGYCPERKNYAS